VDGLSLTSLLPGETKLDRPALYWHYPHYWGGGNGVTPYSVVRAGDWKLIHWYEGDRWELYNLRADVSEAHDLTGQEPGKLQELRAGLAAWINQTNAQLPVRK
jgi:arylsulfatase A